MLPLLRLLPDSMRKHSQPNSKSDLLEQPCT